MSGEPKAATVARTGGAGIIRTLALLYSRWTTLAMNAVFFAAYYAFFYELIVRANSGYFLLTVPLWLLVLFVLASSTLATVAVSYLRITLGRRAIPGIAGSPVGIVVGSFVASCACNLPLVAPILYFIGLNSLEVSGVITFLAEYQQTIVEAIVLVDLVSIYYYVRQISRSGFARARPVNNAVNRPG